MISIVKIIIVMLALCFAIIFAICSSFAVFLVKNYNFNEFNNFEKTLNKWHLKTIANDTYELLLKIPVTSNFQNKFLKFSNKTNVVVRNCDNGKIVLKKGSSFSIKKNCFVFKFVFNANELIFGKSYKFNLIYDGAKSLSVVSLFIPKIKVNGKKYVGLINESKFNIRKLSKLKTIG